MNFNDYCGSLADPNPLSLKDGRILTFSNRNGAEFLVDFDVAIAFLEFLVANHDKCHAAWSERTEGRKSFEEYDEEGYRAIYKTAESIPSLNSISTLGRSQTNQLTRALTKLICYLAEINYQSVEENTHFDKVSLTKALNGLKNKSILITKSAPCLSLESEFRKWLAEREYSERSINSYAGTSIKCADDLLKSAGLLDQGGLYCVTSIELAKKLLQDLESVSEWLAKNETGNDMYRTGVKKYLEFLSARSVTTSLPKPFLLLAGISGTGKSRFVRKQAEGDEGCYELVPVRPDWHEPSDLLGYVSRINGERYVVTPFLKFLVNAWRDAFATYADGKLTLNSGMKTFWLCLDEMNLAPVEQYFADYLSVLETRSWENGCYSTYPLIQPAKLEIEANNSLRIGLGLEEDSPLWSFFVEKGIQLAPNLVVAGTVNMDETTHGFSRKVIDRAYTIDFGDFFPNHFDQIFTQQTRPKKLAYSRLSSVDRSEPMSVADPEGTKSIQFLTEVNEIFRDTPYQLAFRALNELLVTLKCFAPSDDLQLKAVWDDFLMAKLLPRVEGDLQKIGQGDTSLLKKLGNVLATNGFDGNRPDLLSESVSGGAVETGFRSPKKLSWMQKRLDDNGFTSFWP